MDLIDRDLTERKRRKEFFITVVGMGRMGLSLACLYADAGFKVACLDVDSYIVEKINKGITPFDELKLDILLTRNLKKGNVNATINVKEVIPKSDIIIITISTSIDKRKRSDYSSLEVACRNIGLNLKQGTLIIIENTVGPYVTETLVKEVFETSSGLKAGIDFGLAYSPIRASVGKIINDVKNYSKIVAAIDKKSLTAAKAVLKTVTKGELIEVNNFKTGEAIKIFENVYRDVNIALANELAKFCEKAGIDYLRAQKVANTQPQCHLLNPGIVSGNTTKIPYLLLNEAENIGAKLKLTYLARRINDETLKHAYYLIKTALHSCEKSVRRSRVAIMGISYHANINKANESSILELVKLLRRRGAKVVVFDPYLNYSELKDLGYPAEKTMEKTIESSDCVLITVGHDKFKHLNLRKMNVLMKKPSALIDLANIVNPSKAQKEGFIYRGLGKGNLIK